MSIKHTLKLIPARYKWLKTRIFYAYETFKLLKERKSLDTLRVDLNQKMLESERKSPTSPETYILKGKVALLDELIARYE